MELSQRSREIFLRYQNDNFHRLQRKRSPDEIHKIFQEIGTFYNKFSPSGCSKNFLAVSSDIDREIEKAKSYGNISRSSAIASTSICKPYQNFKLFPSLRKTHQKPSKYQSSSKPSVKLTESTEARINLYDKMPKSLRLRKINKIIFNCEGIKSDISEESAAVKSNIGGSKNGFKALSKILKIKDQESDILTRCKEHCDDNKYSENDLIKIAKGLRRNWKKIWKFNHISFMKSVDKVVCSFKQFKEDDN